MILTTVFAFLLALALLIVVHEYGHYRVAVACGVRVLRFSIGFGRVVWRRQRSPDDTEFVLSMLPLGGYVRMLDEREAPVPASQLDQAFNRKPLAQRAAIVLAGPVANLLLAVLLYAATHWIGIDEPRARIAAPEAGSLAEKAGLQSGDLVLAVSRDGLGWSDIRSMTELRWQLSRTALEGQDLLLQTRPAGAADSSAPNTITLPLASLNVRDADATLLPRIGLGAPYSEPVLGEVKPGGPGADAGLVAGDRVVSVDGRAVHDAGELRDRIREAGSATPARLMHWRISRGGELRDVDLTPRVADDAGHHVGRIDAFVGAAPEMVKVRYGPIEGLTQAVERTWDVSALSLRMMGRMVIGEASLKNLSGPLTIADYAGQSARLGWVQYLGFLALISVSLGVLNLLPLPMLDGGHLMYYLFEGVTGRPVSESWLKWLQRGGAVIMLVMMSLALSNDVARLFGLP